MSNFFKVFSLVAVFALISACGGGEGDDEGASDTPPASPSGVLITANDGENTLEWNAVS